MSFSRRAGLAAAGAFGVKAGKYAWTLPGKAYNYYNRKPKSMKNNRKKNLRRAIRSVLKPENKYHDVQLLPTSFSVATMHLVTSGYLNDIDQFDDDTGPPSENTRIGNKISTQRLRFNLTVQNNTTANTQNLVRVCIIRQKTNLTSSILGVNQVFQAGSGNLYNAQFDHERRKGFTVLHDRTYRLDKNGGPNEIQDKIILNLKGKVARYNGIAGTDYGDHGIYVFVGSSHATLFPIISFDARLEYTDV